MGDRRARGQLGLLLAEQLFFLLGVWCGDTALRWIERKWASHGDMLLRRASRPLLILPAVLVGGSMLMDRRRGRGELEAITRLEEELGDDGQDA